ncbi:probable NRPS-like enzyme [Rhynchosporium secalis]|uniref:Probable NRPS-like enzyme n=1 Tax=Rhynchosporium secalis TaxID=38038 RepID=A0A1E1M6N8_RHYSE|nr:probable NRPS-like enzyme [Rhynchosporium secalis]
MPPSEAENGSNGLIGNVDSKSSSMPLGINGTNEDASNHDSSSKSNGREGPLKSQKSKQAPVLNITKDLSALITQQIRTTPDAVALEDETTSLTYSELDLEVSNLANRLGDHGVGRDRLVGVLLGRSANYVISCLAALRAGGAFLVLELAYPPSLLADVINDAKPVVVITNSTQAGQIDADVPLMIIDELEKGTYTPSEHRKQSLVPADDDLERLAFVSYSSGTTGKPKGIANPHMAPVLSYDLRFRLSDLSPGDRVACNVFFIWEMLRPLLRGATVVCVPDEASYDPVALVELLAKRQVTETLMTPTLLAACLSRHSDIANDLPALRTLWFNGEVVTTDLARRAMKALPNTRLLNCYSASETHEIACGDIREVIETEAAFCPVGPPINPEHTYILDLEGKKVDPGVAGELFVGGNLLARGYLNLAETTAEAFIPNPFDQTPGSRMYRTGDLARMLPSGILEITGRVGAMMKIRGYSVVPGKVENAIIELLAVKQCAVIAHGEGLDRQLIAYIVHDKEDPGNRPVPIIDEAGYSLAARRALSGSLAQYMIPALWVELDELPTNRVSGKADLKRLPPPGLKISTMFNHTKTERESSISIEAVAEIWATSLSVPFSSVTKEHTFFDLGGHSLTLADLATRMSRTFGITVPVSRLVMDPTLEGHLGVVRGIREGHTAAVQDNLPAVLKADAILDEDIKSSGTSIQTLKSLKDDDTVLLTGATGFLGAFLLCDLLESTSARIVCLVRFNSPEDEDAPAGVARIRKNLLDLGLWQDSILDRIDVIPGNLSHKKLGLAPDHYKELVSGVKVIVHAGATVNLVYPYAALRDANVGGTREILRLASESGATLQYVSTNGVLPPSTEAWPETAMIEIEDVPNKLVDGYGQTKWVAEQLVYAAGARGMPVRILRAGTISGHSTSGSTNTYDLFNALLVESLHLGYSPNISGWRAEMTPVDYVSKAITTLADDTTSSNRIFHLGDANPVNTQSLFDDLSKLGFPTKPLEWKSWVSLWAEKRGSLKRGAGAFTADILRGGMPSVEFLRDITILNDEATKPALASLPRPSIDVKLVETYARHWYARGWLPRPPTRMNQANGFGAKLVKKGAFTGLVAVITGASSGIGAATATALAREGAHVVLAARRTDALEALKSKISPYGGKVLVHKTDVTKREEVESLVRTAEEKFAPVDILVSCAGVMYFTMMANVNVSDWEKTVDVNCKGLLNVLSSSVPSMLSRGKGHIVAISSDAGRKVFPGLGVYSASKFFVEATLQALRVETAGSGLRVTSIQPGNVATDLLGLSSDQEALKKYGEPSGAKVLDAEDVAEAIIYALRQPEHVAVNEVMIEPRDEPI